MNAIIAITLFLMNNNFQYCLGKSIEVFPDAYPVNEGMESYTKFYGLDGTFDFYGNSVYYLNLETDSTGTIISVGFMLEGKINRGLYDKIIEEYGSPKTILKIGQTILEQNNEDLNYSSSSTKSKAIKSSFEQDPEIIIWDLENLNFSINKHPNNTHSFLHFKVNSF